MTSAVMPMPTAVAAPAVKPAANPSAPAGTLQQQTAGSTIFLGLLDGLLLGGTDDQPQLPKKAEKNPEELPASSTGVPVFLLPSVQLPVTAVQANAGQTGDGSGAKDTQPGGCPVTPTLNGIDISMMEVTPAAPLSPAPAPEAGVDASATPVAKAIPAFAVRATEAAQPSSPADIKGPVNAVQKSQPVQANAPAVKPQDPVQQQAMEKSATDSPVAEGEAVSINRREERQPDIRPDGPAGAGPAIAEPSRPATEAAPRTEAAKPAAPVAPEPQTPRPTAARDVTLRIENAQETVQIRMAERGGEIRVMVSTPDRHLAASLGERLPELVHSLERGGFQAETWRPSASAGSHSDNQHPTWSGSQQGQQQREQQRRNPHAPAWVEEWEHAGGDEGGKRK